MTSSLEKLPVFSVHDAAGKRVGLICGWDNVRLMIAAPDLLAACEAQHQAIDRLFAMLIIREDFFPSKSGQPWDAMLMGSTAIRKAKGGDA